MTTIKVTIALLAGLAAGAALGLLYAPQAGTETRDQLNDSLENLGESIKETAITQIEKLVGSFQGTVVDAIKSMISGTATEEYPDDLEHA